MAKRGTAMSHPIVRTSQDFAAQPFSVAVPASLRNATRRSDPAGRAWRTPVRFDLELLVLLLSIAAGADAGTRELTPAPIDRFQHVKITGPGCLFGGRGFYGALRARPLRYHRAAPPSGAIATRGSGAATKVARAGRSFHSPARAREMAGECDGREEGAVSGQWPVVRGRDRLRRQREDQASGDLRSTRLEGRRVPTPSSRRAPRRARTTSC